MGRDFSDFLAEAFVKQLVEARAAKGISINKLAWMSGVSPKAIAFIEQGVHSPTLKTFLRLVLALELDLSQALEQILNDKKQRLESVDDELGEE